MEKSRGRAGDNTPNSSKQGRISFVVVDDDDRGVGKGGDSWKLFFEGIQSFQGGVNPVELQYHQEKDQNVDEYKKFAL